ncbi:MAG: hypothetical protein KDB79_11640 [Acidobacteria bacterium]|nr:hypothetical protein [Acidobacteriota bacterium]
MADLPVTFSILEIAKDLLFVEEADFYPDEIWEDFAEAFYLFLTDDEIEVLNYRYGTDDFCEFSVDKRRRILSDLALRFHRSEFYSEMDSIMKNCEREMFADHNDDQAARGRTFSDDFVRNSLMRLGLDHLPGSIGGLEFDSQIGNFPVYVWRSSEVPMPVATLTKMLKAAADEGFSRFFIVAQPRAIVDLPVSIEGCIPFTFIPIADQDPNRRDEIGSDPIFTM